MQPKILYPARLPFNIEGRKEFPKQKLKDFMTTKPALQRNFKGEPLSQKKKKTKSNKGQKGRKDITRNINSTGNTLAPNSSLSIITQSINGLKAPIKRYKLSEWIKNKNPQESRDRRIIYQDHKNHILKTQH